MQIRVNLNDAAHAELVGVEFEDLGTAKRSENHGGFAHEAPLAARVFERTVEGELWGPTGPIPGSSVSTTMSENSFQIAFAIATRGEIF